jgi:natural product biosynthesis luciferase-like monooxygenase protein
MDNQVKLRGIRIEASEIESHILRVSGVSAVTVAIKEVSGQPNLVAYVVAGSEKLTADLIETQISASLPDYMLPAHFEFLTAIPVKGNGKVDKKALPAITNLHLNAEEYVAPANEVEVKLTEICSELLQQDKIGVKDNFFKIGGNSLLVMQLFGKISGRFGKIISIQDIFTQPTIRQIAQKLAVAENQTGLTITAIDDISHPLSFAQRRLWFVHEFEGGSKQYNIPVATHLTGDLDTQKLQQSLNEILLRHQGLNIQIASSEQDVYTEQRQANGFSLSIEDLSSLPKTEQISELDRLWRELRGKSFDLRQGPLVEGQLVKLNNRHHELFVVMHHLVSDGVSMGLFLRELGIIYSNLVDGNLSTPPVLPVQYGDYAHWQRKWLDEGVLEPQLNYWKQQLAHLPTVHGLPLDGQRPTKPLFDGSKLQTHIDASQLASIKAFCQAHDVTLFVFLHSVFNLLLSKFSGEKDIVTGSPVSGRHYANIDQLIGLFINTLVLRCDLSGDKSFVTLMQEHKTTILGAFANQDIPFEKLVEVLNPNRSFSHSPLFQILFSMQKEQRGMLEMVGVTPGASWIETEEHSVKYDLELHVTEHDNGVILNWLYDTALFNKETIQRLNSCFEYLAASAINTPESSIHQLRMMPDAMYREVEKTFNATSMGLDRSKRVETLFLESVAQYSDRDALVFQGKHYSYAELDEMVEIIIQRLQENGTHPGDIVAICLERSPMMIASLLAVLKTGAVYLPLDPTYPQDRLDFILADSGSRLLLSQSCLLEFLDFPKNLQVIDLDVGELKSESSAVSSAMVSELPKPENAAAYIIYTSGSTGKPKGVSVSHVNLLNFFLAMERGLDHETVLAKWMAVTSISFDIAVLELLYNLCTGNTIYLQEERLTASDKLEDVDFSLFYFAAEESKAVGNKYQLLLKGAKFADENDLSAVWVPERHFNSFGDHFPNPSVAAAAVAATTSQIKIRSGSVVFPLHDPIRIAEEWSMVDNLSEGRVEISAASGWHPNDFVLAPEAYADRHKIMHDSIDTVKALWRGESLVRTNGVGNNTDIQLHPRPVQSDLPMWITAAGNPETFRSAGASGANVLTHMLSQNKKDIQEKIAIYREARKEAGYDPDTGRVALMLHTFVGESDEQVKLQVEAPFKCYLKQSLGLIKPLADELGMNMDKELDVIIDLAFQRYFKTSSLFGSVETCIQIAEELSTLGVDEIACLIDFGVDHELAIQNLSNLAKVQNKLKRLARRSSYLKKRNESLSGSLNLEALSEVTHLQCTPSYVRELLLSTEGKILLQQLQQLLVGGEAIDPELVGQLQELGVANIFNMYGPTETTIWSTFAKLDTKTVSIGKPITNTRCYVVDKNDALVPVGVSGELLIAGDGVALGYHQRDELNKARFSSLTLASGKSERVYRTGDLVQWRSDGQLVFISRIDDQVKYRGYRIELGEIQSLIAELSVVKQAVVVLKGEAADQKLLAYATFKEAEQQETYVKQIKQKLKEHLPTFMVPEEVIPLTEFPLTPNGKVDRKALHEPPQISDETAYVKPSTPMEKTFCEIWQELLGIANIGVKDDFFKIGGHSLFAVRFVAMVKETLSIRMSIRDVFNHSTIESLARYVEETEATKLQMSKLYDLAEDSEEMEEFEL